MGIKALGYVVIETAQPDKWDEFLTQVAGVMRAPDAADGAAQYRIDDAPFRFRIEATGREWFQAAGYEVADAAALAALALPATAQQANTFPNKPVNIVTAFAAGSGPDAVLRQISEKLSKLWNQPVTITNKPGGGGFIAIDATQRMPADGYTLLQLDSEHLSALPLLYKSKNFVTLNAFDPVAPLFRTPFLVSVATDSSLSD